MKTTREYNQTAVAKRKALGQCHYCGNPDKVNKTRCAKCLAANVLANARRRVRLRDAGLCITCGRAATEGRSKCAVHLKQASMLQRGHGQDGGFSRSTVKAALKQYGLVCMPVVGVCHCPNGPAIDETVPWPGRWSLAFDHIIPKALGGTDTPPNCQPAHLVCNSIAGGARKS